MWNRQDLISKAEKLKPELKHMTVRPVFRDGVRTLESETSIVLDFGNHYVGYFSFSASTEGSHQDAPALLRIKFCESERELDEENDDYNGWISKSWIQEELIHVDDFSALVHLNRRYAFRYVKIEAISLSSKYNIVIEDAYADTVTSADDNSVEVFGNNDLERELDKVSIRTLRNCMQEVFEDGPKRDRRLWMGDLRLQAISNYATFKDFNLVKRCLYLFAGCADDEGRIPACLFISPNIVGDDTYMFDYSLFFIATLRDYMQYSGDEESVRELLPAAIRQWELSKERFNGEDLIPDSDEIGWCFLDWNLDLNKQAGAQFVYIYSLKALKEIFIQLNELERLSELEEEIEAKTNAARKFLWDENKGLFVSGADRQISYATQSWAILADVLNGPQDYFELMNRLSKHGDTCPMITPYMNHVYVEALISAGMKEEAYIHMCYYWGGMVREGADTFYELYDPNDPNQSPYGSCAVNSYCHAWSCTPTYFLRIRHLTNGE